MNHLKEIREVMPSDDWAADNAAGRQLATAYVAEARKLNDPGVINGALRSIAAAGRWTGVEVGFAFALANAVLQP